MFIWLVPVYPCTRWMQHWTLFILISSCYFFLFLPLFWFSILISSPSSSFLQSVSRSVFCCDRPLLRFLFHVTRLHPNMASVIFFIETGFLSVLPFPCYFLFFVFSPYLHSYFRYFSWGIVSLSLSISFYFFICFILFLLEREILWVSKVHIVFATVDW